MTKPSMTQEEKAAYDAAESPTKSQRTSRNKAETVAATPDQEISVGQQIISAQNAVQQGLLKTAKANSDVLAEMTLNLTKEQTAFKVATQMASIFEGDNNVSEVSTAFLYSISRSGYQIADAIANLESSQPLLLQAIAPKQLTAA